jgi:hypothetical protein
VNEVLVPPRVFLVDVETGSGAEEALEPGDVHHGNATSRLC